MPGEPAAYALLNFVLLAGGDMLLLYDAYLALQVWRGLTVRIYRARALWTSLLALLITFAYSIESVVQVLYPGAVAPFHRAGLAGSDIAYIALVLVAFAWMDRTVASVIRMDFTRRSLLGWQKARPLYWGIISITAASYVSAYYLLTPFGYVSPAYLEGILVILIAVPLAYAASCLVVGSRRTRDETFRLHVRWLAYFAATFAVQSFLYVFVGNATLNLLFLMLLAYCLFRLARSLVPVNRFTEPASTGGRRPEDRLPPSA